jgi:hypothetical protein
MWHEFSESSSDPEANLHTAWSGKFCGEPGHCCERLFGTLQVAAWGGEDGTVSTKALD